MERVKGIEPFGQNTQPSEYHQSDALPNHEGSRIELRESDSHGPDLAHIVEIWDDLPVAIRDAIVSIADSVAASKKGGEQ